MSTSGTRAPGKSLPASASRLIGRAGELARIEALLDDNQARLITLTGVGGIGKTRLALEVARARQLSFRDGARFVDVAPIQDPALLLSGIATAIDLRHTGSEPLLDVLKRALGKLCVLLVLDNFEQATEAAPVLADLLGECPELTIIATSRVPLRLTWEYEIGVVPLEVPPPELDARPSELLDVPSVALLLERMGQLGRSEPDLIALAEIARRLDGIPLALELAAARARLLSPRALLEHFARPMQILTGGPRDAPARHQSLRAAFTASYEHLGQTDQHVFRELAVFEGGCSIERVARVTVACSNEADVLDCLERLMEAGLLRRTEDPSALPTRVRLLEPVREYALEHLEASGERDTTAARHAAAYLELAEDAEPRLRGPDQNRWLAVLGSENDNLRAALRWFLSRGDAERSLRMVGALAWYWWVLGMVREGIERATEALDLPIPRSESAVYLAARARALSGAGILSYWQGEFATADKHLRASLQLESELSDSRGHGFTFNMLGNCAQAKGDLTEAERLYEQSLQACRAAGDTRGAAQAIMNLGLVAFNRKRLDRAETLLTETIALQRTAGDVRSLGFALGTLALVDCYRRNFGAAQTHLRECLSLWQDQRDRALLPLLLETCAVIAIAAGNGVRGLRLAGAATAIRDQTGAVRPPVWMPELERWIERARATTGRAESASAWDEGQHLSASEALAEAMRVDTAGANVQTGSALSGLTPRETEVLAMVASGATNREIAAKLVVSVATVERHVANIYAKIGARGRAEATAFAITRGLLPQVGE